MADAVKPIYAQILATIQDFNNRLDRLENRQNHDTKRKTGENGTNPTRANPNRNGRNGNNAHDHDPDPNQDDHTYGNGHARKHAGPYQDRNGPHNGPRQGPNREEDEPWHGGKDLKLVPPTFAGQSNPNTYLDWEERMEYIFEYYNYSDTRKIALAAAQLTDNALAWWDRDVSERRTRTYPQITTWADMSYHLRKIYVPTYSQRNRQKLPYGSEPKKVNPSNLANQERAKQTVRVKETQPKSISTSLLEPQGRPLQGLYQGMEHTEKEVGTLKDEVAPSFVLTQKRPSDPTLNPYDMATKETEPIQDFDQVINPFLSFDDSKTEIINFPNSKTCEKIMGTISFLEPQRNKHVASHNANEMVQPESCFLVSNTTMTPITHLSLAKSVEKNAGTNEEHSDQEDIPPKEETLPDHIQTQGVQSVGEDIKEKPPDTSLGQIQDEMVLRTEPSQGGEDDASLKTLTAPTATPPTIATERSPPMTQSGTQTLQNNPNDAAIPPVADLELYQPYPSSRTRFDKDTCARQGAYRADQKELSNKSKFPRSVTHQGFITNWSCVYRSSDQAGINSTIMVISDNLASEAYTDLRSLSDVLRINHEESEHKANFTIFSSHLESASKLNHLNRSSDEGVMDFPNLLIPNITRLDIYALIRGFRPNQEESSYESNFYGTLGQFRSPESWIHPNHTFGLEDINFLNQKIPDLPYLDICALKRVFRPNQEEFGYESTCYGLLGQFRSSESWIQPNHTFGLEDVNFLNREILDLPYLEPWSIKDQRSQCYQLGCVLKSPYIFQNVPTAHNFLPKLSRYKDPSTCLIWTI